MQQVRYAGTHNQIAEVPMTRGRFGRSPRPAAITSAGVVLALLAGLAVGFLSGSALELALPAAGLMIVGALALAEPRILPVLAVPGVLIMARVLGELVSVSDFILAAALVVTLLLIRPSPTPTLRAMLWGGTVYLAMCVPTLLMNPYAENFIEWGHEVVLVLGSLLVGFAVGREGAAPVALWLMTAGCAFIAGWTILAAMQQLAATGQFTDVYLPGLHKNLIGGALATGAIIAIAHPRWMGGRRWVSLVLGVVMIVAILMSQSRQGLAAVVAGLGVLAFVARDRHRWLKAMVPVALVATVVALYASVQDQLSGVDAHNSATIRLEIFDAAIAIWRSAPIFGVGMRWWYTGDYPGAFQPPSVWLEVGTTVGWFGLIGFVLMFVIALLALNRLPREYSAIAIAVIVTRLVQAQFDLYWVAGQGAALWLIAGIAVGVAARNGADPEREGLRDARVAGPRALVRPTG